MSKFKCTKCSKECEELTQYTGYDNQESTDLLCDKCLPQYEPFTGRPLSKDEF